MLQTLDNDREFLAVKWKEREMINSPFPKFPTIIFVMGSSDFVLRKEQKSEYVQLQWEFYSNTQTELYLEF
jgi:hypothetical protein